MDGRLALVHVTLLNGWAQCSLAVMEFDCDEWQWYRVRQTVHLISAPPYEDKSKIKACCPLHDTCCTSREQWSRFKCVQDTDKSCQG